MVNNAVIDWFQPWPAEALRSVADKFLAETDLPEDLRPSVTAHMMAVHQSVLDASGK
jgi:dynein heavy chain